MYKRQSVGRVTGDMFPGFSAHLYDCPDFFACVLGVIIVKYVFEHSEVVFALCAVHIIVDSDKTDIISGKNEILQASHIGILPAKAGEVFEMCIRDSVLTDPARISLAPGIYSIFYDVSALISKSTFMQITPYYNGCPHIEYGIYFATGPSRSNAFDSVSFMIEVPVQTVFNLTYNSTVTATVGTLTMAIFKLRREL